MKMEWEQKPEQLLRPGRRVTWCETTLVWWCVSSRVNVTDHFDTLRTVGECPWRPEWKAEVTRWCPTGPSGSQQNRDVTMGSFRSNCSNQRVPRGERGGKRDGKVVSDRSLRVRVEWKGRHMLPQVKLYQPESSPCRLGRKRR
jgi:hypothetical protein